jgi:hypothetical protein
MERKYLNVKEMACVRVVAASKHANEPTCFQGEQLGANQLLKKISGCWTSLSQITV